MDVIVNGKKEALSDGITIGEFLKGENLDSGSVVVELNADIVDRTSYDTIVLNENDILEVLRFVGGG